MESPSNLDTNGSLRINPLAELFTEIAQNRLNGSLRIEHAAEKIVVYFDAGETVFAVSNARRHRLFEMLLQADKISREQLVAIPEFTSDLSLKESLIKNNLFEKTELNAFFLKLLPDILVIFNDAVVDNSDRLFNIAMGMRIAVAWNAVCGPTRMGNADGRMRNSVRTDQFFQVTDLALSFTNDDLTVLGRTNAYSA